MRKGYITILFSASIGICMSLIIVMLYGIRENAVRMKSVSVADIAMTSVFAEYNKALWEQYELIFVDSSYMTRAHSLVLSEQHLKEFANKNFNESEFGLLGGVDLLKIRCTEAEATAVTLASDNRGAAILHQVTNLMKYHYKINYVADVEDWVSKIEGYKLGQGASYEEASEAAGKLKNKYDLDYSGWLPSISGGNNLSEDYIFPFSILSFIAGRSNVSTTKINNNFYAGKRQLNQGNLIPEYDKDSLEDFYFREYLIKVCGNYIQEKENSILSYQQEYLCAGKESDCDNLASIVRRIMVIREAANMITLNNDGSRKGQIESFCLGICSLVGVPEAAELLAQIIIACWANFESIMDVKILLKGGKIPLIKEPSEWITGLKAALTGSFNAGSHKNGMSYEDYLKVFMYMTGINKLIMRFMSLVEMDIRNTDGNQYFRIDNCFDEWVVTLYFSSEHGYDFTATRRRKILN